MSEVDSKDPPRKRKKIFLFTTVCFFLIAIIIFFCWLTMWRFEEYTNDAYVNGNMVELTAQVPGIVSAIYADNTDYVKEGQVLIALDKTDYHLAFTKSTSRLAETVRNVKELFLQVEERRADLEAKTADLLRAEQDLENRIPLVDIGGVSREEFEHVETTFLRAKADVLSAKLALAKARAQVKNTTVRGHPLVRSAAAAVRTAWVNLERCQIVSPVDGYVAMRSAQLGEWVKDSEPLLAIIPLNELWVDANFKETQLKKIRIGQKARVRADIYGRAIDFHGKVIGINPGTGSVFSALPPQNATGNWIKIVQRVPVRVSLKKKELAKHPLWLGLSMEVSIDVRDTEGDMLSRNASRTVLYQTEVYSKQQRGVEAVIDKIISKNSFTDDR